MFQYSAHTCEINNSLHLFYSGSKSKGDDITVTWDNPEELEAYIVKLQAAADRLTSENRRLRKSHQTIQDKVNCVYFVWF